jgi:hypothetical protein
MNTTTRCDYIGRTLGIQIGRLEMALFLDPFTSFQFYPL